jgi:hypothetical protein
MMNRKERRKLKAVGATKVTFFAGLDDEGDAIGWFWIRDAVPDAKPHGPFETRAEAQRDVETTLFGSGCTVVDAGPMKPRTGERLQ